MSWNEIFWTRPDVWPFDTRDYVFLARAVHQIGKHLFGDEWRGVEPTVRAPKPAPRPLDEVLAEREQKQGLAATYTLAELTAEQQRRLRPAPDPEEVNRTLAAMGRWNAVQRRIADAARDGVLKTAVRPYAGGEPIGLTAGVWNTEVFWPWFEECRMHPEDPFRQGSLRPRSPESWIFIGRQSLDQFLETVPAVGKKKSRASRPGQKSLREADKPLLEEMKGLIDRRKAQSAEDAARLVARKATGRGTMESKTERLAKRYREEFRKGARNSSE
jgi:hypothetical protein